MKISQAFLCGKIFRFCKTGKPDNNALHTPRRRRRRLLFALCSPSSLVSTFSAFVPAHSREEEEHHSKIYYSAVFAGLLNFDYPFLVAGNFFPHQNLQLNVAVSLEQRQ
jgi:hypothetical protein